MLRHESGEEAPRPTFSGTPGVVDEWQGEHWKWNHWQSGLEDSDVFWIHSAPGVGCYIYLLPVLVALGVKTSPGTCWGASSVLANS